MTNQLNEFKDYPRWIDSLTKEEQYNWYLRAKEVIEILNRLGDDTVDLNAAILNYETRYGA